MISVRKVKRSKYNLLHTSRHSYSVYIMLSKREYNLYASSGTNLYVKHGKNDAETCEIINIIYGLTFKHRIRNERGCDKDLEHVQFEGLQFRQEIGAEKMYWNQSSASKSRFQFVFKSLVKYSENLPVYYILLLLNIIHYL